MDRGEGRPIPDMDELVESLSLKPVMKPGDLRILANELSRATNYFEYGSGGSSNLAVVVGVRCMSVVESSLEWLERVRVGRFLPSE